jgi:hypothetical protein
MNKYELQGYYLNEIQTGHPDDFLCDLSAEVIQEEFSNLLSVWANNRLDANKLRQAMSNEIAAMICRATKSAPDVVLTKEDYQDYAEELRGNQ